MSAVLRSHSENLTQPAESRDANKVLYSEAQSRRHGGFFLCLWNNNEMRHTSKERRHKSEAEERERESERETDRQTESSELTRQGSVKLKVYGVTQKCVQNCFLVQVLSLDAYSFHE